MYADDKVRDLELGEQHKTLAMRLFKPNDSPTKTSSPETIGLNE